MRVPFKLFGKFKANSLRLAAKPGQISPDDVSVQAGETGIAPGQTVTDLKSAGIDVQIQKGKVVIAKDKVVVKKGEVITANLAKALHTLDIMPFMAVIEPISMFADGMLYSKKVLGISTESTTEEISLGFRNALHICFELKIVNAYTINNFITKAYRTALHVGLEAKALDSGIVELLLARAASEATALSGKTGSAPATETETKTE